ncbi:MAG: hypothetical protein E7099_01655 [Mediterranea massiliensis]|nr:hypothetical protein [Mediterranea massiliensis]
MKNLRLFLAFAIFFTLCSAFTMKKVKEQNVYAYGVAASFNDTVVYYTEIQLLDSVKLDKNGFLPSRELYSIQLRNHLEYQMMKPHYTCMIYFSDNKEKLQKNAKKVLDKYRANKQMRVEVIDPKSFAFKNNE